MKPFCLFGLDIHPYWYGFEASVVFPRRYKRYMIQIRGFRGAFVNMTEKTSLLVRVAAMAAVAL